jgi:hypothetical protein
MGMKYETTHPLIDEVLKVGDDDILYRLHQEERERAEAIRLWRNSPRGSIHEDDHIHRLVGDAAIEIIRLRLKLRELGAVD